MNSDDLEQKVQELPQVEDSPSETAKLNVNGKSLDLPVVTGTEEEKGLDVTQLRAETGCITLDPGFANTGACQSGITFLDGEKGILRYRGIPIEELAEKASYLETAYLLINGSLPSKSALDTFSAQITQNSSLPESVAQFASQLPEGTHPMAALSSLVAVLSGAYPDLTHPRPTVEQIEQAIAILLAQVPTLAAAIYRKEQGQKAIAPREDLTYVSNFLAMMLGSGKDSESPDEVVVQALRQILILHADHEQNCSTSTVRLVGSSRANAFAAISAGMGALWGPLHGGANEAVIKMLQQIEQGDGDFTKYLAMAKDKNSGFRLMGFGHRVYKNFDPRAKILKAACDKVLGRLGIQDPLLDIAKQLEAAAIADDYFVSRKLYPNVDFYSGIILRAIGIPTSYFTVIFAFGRMAGWLAHWREMLEAPGFRIGRPRQIYTGPAQQHYLPIDQRT